MARAGTYNLIQDFGLQSDDGYASLDPHWIIAVFHLGAPVSFSRKEGRSSKNVTDGAILRSDKKPLVITDDCISISVANNKTGHIKTMNATLKQTDVNYLVEILPGDYVLGWIMNTREKQQDVIKRLYLLDPQDPCNRFDDGLKFVGRVDDVFKHLSVDPGSGYKMVAYSIKCSGFQELDTQLYYDYALASSDVMKQDIGTYLARLGSSINKVFGKQTQGQIEKDNVNRIIPELVDLIVGKGPKKENVIHVRAKDGKQVTNTPSADNDSPYAYLVPLAVGHVLGRINTDDNKVAGHVMSYAQLMEMWIGVQDYSNKDGGYRVFVPDLVPENENESRPNRRYTGKSMMGTFLPMMPDFANRPLWSVFQQYLNPSINELYTALKVNSKGYVVPMVVMRQIPFTTDAFAGPTDPPPLPEGNLPEGTSLEDAADMFSVGAITANQYLALSEGTNNKSANCTKFLDLPRWKIPSTIVRSVNIGRSNGSRVNFVHVYGQSAYLAEANVPIQAQMIRNPPVRDDLDIMRSGLRPYMMTVECWVDNQVGKVAGYWMALIADWTMGSHLTLNGQMDTFGIQSPIAEGDNLQFDGVVYHIMSVNHQAQINPGNGTKTWTTHLALCNGLRDMEVGESSTQPIYPGLSKLDNTRFDPGMTEEHHPTTGGDGDNFAEWADPEVLNERRTESELAQDEAAARTVNDLERERVDREGELGDIANDPDIKGLL